MTQHWYEFIACGMHHRLDPSVGSFSLNQPEHIYIYIVSLKPIARTQPQRGNGDQECEADLYTWVRSVLGAIAYAQLKRLARDSRLTALRHVLALNKLVHDGHTHTH